MRWHHRVVVTLRGWFWSSALDRELDEELQFHFDRQVQANLEAGMTPAQARRSAAITIGNPVAVREASRDGRSGAWLRQFGRDLSYSTRLLTKAPGFALASIAIVALGIGSVTAIFSVVYGVVLKPLPFHEPDRLAQLWTRAQSGERDGVNGADHRDWRAGNSVFTDIALVNTLANFNLTGGGEPERLLGARISPNLLTVLGVSPVVGRNFTEEEDEYDNSRFVLLSHGLWQRRFAANPNIVGQSILLAGVPHVVVGVMGPDFHYPGREFQVWVPLTINPAEMARKVPAFGLQAIARLKDDVTIGEAQSQMDVIAARLADQYPMNRGLGVYVVSLQSDLVTNVRTGLYVMLAAVACLLLVAALNLAGLLSARAAARSREIAVRLALGASRQRVVLQTVAEVLPIVIVGGVLGVALASWAISAFVPLAPAGLPRVENIALNTIVVSVSFAVLAATGLLSCVLPAMQAWRSDVAAASRSTSRGATNAPQQARARYALVVAQIALSLPLLIAATLLTKSFVSVASIDPGFTTANTVSLHLAIPRSKYRDDRQIARFEGEILARVQTLPGVVSAGMVNRLPLAGGAQQSRVELDRSPIAGSVLFGSRVVSRDYFRTIGIPLREGRTFEDRDDVEAPIVVVIDQQVARQAWPGESAIGKRLRFSMPTGTDTSMWMEVVGVVGAIKHEGLDQDANGQIYWHYRQRTQDRAVLVVRGASDAAMLVPSIVGQIRQLDPEQPVYDVRTLDEVFSRSVGQRWLAMALVAVFASMSLFLCCIGVYGVIAFGVTRQQREFGIRLALGASRRAIASGVVTRGLMVAGIGLVLGVALAAALTRSLASMLYGVSTGDVGSFSAGTLAILAVVVLASYLPARRAAAVDPATTLRAD
jgi:predicted permease